MQAGGGCRRGPQIVCNLQGMSLTDARRIALHPIYRDGALGAGDLPELARLKHPGTAIKKPASTEVFAGLLPPPRRDARQA